MGAEKGAHESAGRDDLSPLAPELVQRHADKLAAEAAAAPCRDNLRVEEDDAAALLPVARNRRGRRRRRARSGSDPYAWSGETPFFLRCSRFSAMPGDIGWEASLVCSCARERRDATTTWTRDGQVVTGVRYPAGDRRPAGHRGPRPVVLYHAGLRLPGGYVGVDVFFVISGYLITAMLAGESAAGSNADGSRFYLRRDPAHPAGLHVVLAVRRAAAPAASCPRASCAEFGSSAAVRGLCRCRTYYFMRGTAAISPAAEPEAALFHMWSLAVEEQFYLVRSAVPAGAVAADVAMKLRPADGWPMLALIAGLHRRG